MAIEQTQVLDKLAISGDRTEVILIALECRSWEAPEDVEAMKRQLVAKLNFYAHIVRTGHLYEIFPNVKGLSPRIQVNFLTAPSEKELAWLTPLKAIFEPHGIAFRVEILT